MLKQRFFFTLFSLLLIIAVLDLFVAGGWDNEQAFRNQLEIARSAVANLQAGVASAEKEVQAKRQPVDRIRDELTKRNRQLQYVREQIEIKSRAKELVSRRLRRRIASLEKALQKANDEGKSIEIMKDIQGRANAYRKMLDNTLARYGYEEQIRKLRLQQKKLETAIENDNEALEEPAASLKDAVDFLADERKRLAAAEEKLATLLKEAPGKLAHIAPPHLDRVTVSLKDGDVIYQAHWNPAEYAVDERIRNLEKAIIEQKRELISHRDNLEEMSDQLVAQNRECDRLMQEYCDALWWQAMKTIYTEIVSSAVNIALDFKSMGPYAFLVEAVDVTQKSLRGKLTANYGLPKGAFKQKGFVETAGKNVGKQAWSKFGPKGYIKDTLKNAIKELSGGKTAAGGGKRLIGKEYIVRGLRVTSLVGEMKTVSDLKHVLRGKHLLRGAKVALSEVKSTFGRINSPSKLLATTKQNVKGLFSDKSNLRNFGVKVAVGIAKDYAKGAAEQERMKAWFNYAEADALREVMLKNFMAVALARDFDELVLSIMQEYMKDLIAERDCATSRRDLKIMVDEKLDPGNVFTVKLDFTKRDTAVERVTLGGREVKVVKQDGAYWTGELDLKEVPDSGELVVVAKDRDSNKALDDPTTIASYSGTDQKWLGYEPGPDQHHILRLGEKKPLRSFVFLIDCSGSMADNNRMKKAIEAANQLFASGKFKDTDEISLWIFRGGIITRPVGFTQNHKAVLDTIGKLTPSGGTPLADAIVRSGTYLYSLGRGKYKALIVLTDGQARGVDKAIRTVRRMKQEVEYRLQ